MSQPAQGTPGTLGYDQAGNLMNGNNNHGLMFSLILGALQAIAGAIGGTGSGLPYGADDAVYTNVVGGPGPTQILFKKNGVLVKTRTLTYSGASSTDVLIEVKDT